MKNSNRRIPKIGIYTGKGASHSWLWFVEVFERSGLCRLKFLTEKDIAGKGLEGVQVLAVSGGDTFAVAEALGSRGAAKLEDFIIRGGLYLGSCAGAYLPLHSSKDHLNQFNFVAAKITNLSKTLPEANRLKEKFCTCYGCSFIFHPVREAVQVTVHRRPSGGPKTFAAPLYGGPPMTVQNPASILATYSGFTKETLFLVDRSLAEKTLLGNAAVIREKMGKGYLHLFGPHFEHPRFNAANRFLVENMMRDMPHRTLSVPDTEFQAAPITDFRKKRFIQDVKRELSNSRIVAAGLEMLPLKWTIGNKVYESGKIRVFLEALWQRIKPFEGTASIVVKKDEADLLVQTSLQITQSIRRIKKGWDLKTDTLSTATTLFNLLNKTSALFLEIYFRSKFFHLARENRT